MEISELSSEEYDVTCTANVYADNVLIFSRRITEVTMSPHQILLRLYEPFECLTHTEADRINATIPDLDLDAGDLDEELVVDEDSSITPLYLEDEYSVPINPSESVSMVTIVYHLVAMDEDERRLDATLTVHYEPVIDEINGEDANVFVSVPRARNAHGLLSIEKQLRSLSEDLYTRWRSGERSHGAIIA